MVAPGDCGSGYDARVLPFIFEDFDNMTIEWCAAEAAARGYQYSAVQFGVACYGARDISKYTEPGTCNMPCSGNTSQICGGSCSNSIFALPGKIMSLRY